MKPNQKEQQKENGRKKRDRTNLNKENQLNKREAYAWTAILPMGGSESAFMYGRRQRGAAGVAFLQTYIHSIWVLLSPEKLRRHF